ncbi:MAG: hypothetical protein IID46_05690 [Planctomycetes bacterium]|nr:hypothetical protein [Planctomycetota bacterium]
MARRFNISFVGSPPFRMLGDHLVKDEDFLADARRLLTVEAERFERLASTLEEIDSFIDRERLTETVEEVLGATEDAKKIARTIWRLASMLRDSDEPLEETVSLLKTAINEQMEQLQPDERKTLAERLDRLAARPSGFDRQHKAQQLAEATGKELDELQIICDLRPVFNDERTIVEGGIPVTTLHLDVIDSGTTSSIEIRLNEEQLNDVCDKAQAAIRKLTALKDLLVEKKITLPRTSATINERDKE